MGEPALPRLRMLRGKLQRRAIWTAEHHRHLVLTTRHIESLGGDVHDLIESEQSKIPGHELDDRPETDHRRSDADAGKSELGDRSVDDAHRTELVEQSFGNFVGAVVLSDFFAHEKDAVVALQLFAQRLGQRVMIGDYRHQELESE